MNNQKSPQKNKTKASAKKCDLRLKSGRCVNGSRNSPKCYRNATTKRCRKVRMRKVGVIDRPINQTMDRTMDLLDKLDVKKLEDISLNFNPSQLDNSVITEGKISFRLSGKHYEFSFVKELGAGAYGSVFLLSGHKKTDKIKFPIALKIDKSRSEYEISKKLFKKCKTLQTKLLTVTSGSGENPGSSGSSGSSSGSPYQSPTKSYLYFMQVADGSLRDYKEKYIMKMDPKEASLHIKVICENIRSQLVCMLENDLVYTDMKLANCLYKMVDGEPVFMVGDLGGAYSDDDGDQMATFPPPEYLHGQFPGYFSIKKSKQSGILSWSIGIMLYTLSPLVTDGGTECHKGESYFLFFRDRCSATYNKLLKGAQGLLQKHYGPGFGEYLSGDASKRPDIYKRIESEPDV